MITGAIAVLLLVVVLPASASNGEWGTFWITIGIAAVVLWFGLVSRADDRATVNRMNYWSMSGKDRAKARHRWEAEALAEEEREREIRKAQYRNKERARRNDTRYVDGLQTAGTLLDVQNTKYPCPSCGEAMDEFNRVLYSSGTVYVNYRCRRCGKTLPVKVK